jgi:hypothetical protein
MSVAIWHDLHADLVSGVTAAAGSVTPRPLCIDPAPVKRSGGDMETAAQISQLTFYIIYNI